MIKVKSIGNNARIVGGSQCCSESGFAAIFCIACQKWIWLVGLKVAH